MLPNVFRAIGIWIAAAAAPVVGDQGVTFFVTSDSHYEAVENLDRNQRNRQTVVEMNRLPGTPWPEKLGGGTIERPCAVFALGDLIDDGDKKGQTEAQWKHFVQQFGMDGTDGLLKYPVFEGWGNHDGPPEGRHKHGFSLQARIRKRNARRLKNSLIANLSENGLHYSRDFGGVHFVQLNLYPADDPHPKTRYSASWHHPQQSLAFLKQDLKKHVADSGRPVVLMSHYGFDSDWWHAEEMGALYEAVKDYNVVAYFHGHTGTKVYPWKPPGEDKPLQVINTGQTENGFFVAQITGGYLRAAYRVKAARRYRDQHGMLRYEWDGTWTWRHLLKTPIRAPQPAALSLPPQINGTGRSLQRGPFTTFPDIRGHHIRGHKPILAS